MRFAAFLIAATVIGGVGSLGVENRRMQKGTVKGGDKMTKAMAKKGMTKKGMTKGPVSTSP